MINPLRSIQTAALLDEIRHDSGKPANPFVVRTLLALGADPWAKANDEFNNTVLSLLTLRYPDEEVIDAWFKAAGDMGKSPWLSRGAPNPILHTLSDEKQTKMFHSKIALRLLDAGARLDTREEAVKLAQVLHFYQGRGGDYEKQVIAFMAANTPGFKLMVKDLANVEQIQSAYANEDALNKNTPAAPLASKPSNRL